MHAAGVEQMIDGTELSDFAKKPRAESLDSIGSSIRSTLVAANDTILDNIVARISIVNNHKIRGKWRYILSFALVAAPIVVFVVMMWFQLYRQCTGRTLAIGPLFGAQETSVGPTLNALNIYYCGAYLQAIYPFPKPNESLAAVAYNYCNLEPPYDKYGVDNIPQCRMFKSFYTEHGVLLPDAGSVSCFDATYVNGDVFINYSECIPLSTALINSIQYAVYTTLLVVYLYLAVRLVKKNGCAGLLSYDKWLSTLKNDRRDEKTHHPELTV